MYVKKSISLLLSGALFASLCTGCSQTTMEHHFFTDSVTETEINTEVVENAITPKIKELQEVLGDDLKLEVGVLSDEDISLSAPVGSQDTSEAAREIYIKYIESSLGTVVSSKTLANGIQSPFLGSIILCFSCGGPYDNEIKLSDLMAGTENAIEQLCDAFEGLNPESLDALKTNLKRGKNILTLQISGYHHSESEYDQYYIVAVLAPLEGGNVAWK